MKIPLQLVGVAIWIALASAACSTDNSAEVASLADDTSTSTSGGTASDDSLLTFSACMRENGLDGFEDAIVGPDGKVEFPTKAELKSEDDFKTAFDVCGALLEGTVLGVSKTDADTAEAVDSLLEFARCMRVAGFDMPDPDASGQFPDFKKDSPEFDSAYEQCADELAGNEGSK
ncbi:MAG: hypothetical protein ACR2N7_00335 [Acidimicrobiia bacterium]